MASESRRLSQALPTGVVFSSTFLGGSLEELGVLKFPNEAEVPFLNDRGYAVIVADARGTGASFGHVGIAFDDREITDMGALVDWVTRQDWSNGRVGTYGASYSGILASDAAALDRGALQAIAPTFDFPDLYLTVYPGGVLSDHFVATWSALATELNEDNIPCDLVCRMVIKGPERVDNDKSGDLLTHAIVEHGKDWDVLGCVRQAPDRDSKICSSGKSMGEVSMISLRDAIEKSHVPMHAVAGYFDANSAAQAVQRFETFSNPQELTLAPLSHGGFANTDPFSPTQVAPVLSSSEQLADMADFFDRHLKNDDRPIRKTVRYFVLNGGGWQKSDRWPPQNVMNRDWYLAADHLLSDVRVPSKGIDQYKVDFSATTGTASRYQSLVGFSRTVYMDRALQDQKLLTYTSVPLGRDLQIVGNPTAKLRLATTTMDGEVIVYLEDVSPNGAVTYLTEGVLRLLHRRPASRAELATSADPLHTYLSVDDAPMTPGKVEQVQVGLLPVAVHLRKGERIRVSIAGADEGNLERVPLTGSEIFTILRGNGDSSLEIPELPPTGEPEP